MAAFFLDEDIPLDLGALLARAGHHVTTPRDAQRYGSSDPSQLLYATVTGAIIVTHNGRHFWNLHIAWLAWPLP